MGVRALNVLGVPITLADGRLAIRAKAHAALTAGKWYGVIASRDTSTDITTSAAANDGIAITKAVATLNALHYIGVPERSYAINEIALLIIGGPVKAYAINTGGAITGGTHWLKVLNTAADATLDGAAQTANSVAFACESQNSATASLINMQLLGVPVVV